jgi:nicotinamide phosphoribosyltransferase
MGESEMIKYFMNQFPDGILSIVSDTFDLWQLITKFLPENKEQIMSRNGKLVIRPDSGNPVDIICGANIIKTNIHNDNDVVAYLGGVAEVNPIDEYLNKPEVKGVIELLWDVFGGTVNEQGYKVLDPHIGAIYGDSITLDRQIEIYERLAAKGFASTNIVLGVGSFTYQMNTRDTFGFAAKGAWFEANGQGYDIYKDPVTDDGTKKSLKGLICVTENHEVLTQCTPEQESQGILHTIYEDGHFFNQVTLTQIRERLKQL